MNTTRRPAARWASTRSRLHVPHTKQRGWPFGKAIDGRPPVERRPGGHDGELRDAERRQRRLDEEAEPVRHDLDRDAGRLRPPDERHEPRVVGLARPRSRAAPPGRPRPGPSPRPSADASPCRPASYSADGLLPDARHVLGHDHVGHVGQRDRAVVVDEDGQRRLARPRAAGRAAAAGRPATGPVRSRPSPPDRRPGRATPAGSAPRRG